MWAFYEDVISHTGAFAPGNGGQAQPSCTRRPALPTTDFGALAANQEILHLPTTPDGAPIEEPGVATVKSPHYIGRSFSLVDSRDGRNDTFKGRIAPHLE